MSIATLTQNKSFVMALTLMLLAGSVVLVFYDIEACLNIYYVLFGLFSSDPKMMASLAALIPLFLGIGGLAFIIYSMEYHLKHVGTPGSKKLFIISLSIQLALFGIGYVALGSLLR